MVSALIYMCEKFLLPCLTTDCTIIRLNKMSSLSSEIEKSVVEILFNLVKQEQSQDKNGKYKDLYRISLLHQSQQRKGEHLSLQNNESLPAFDLLTKLKRCLGSSINY